MVLSPDSMVLSPESSLGSGSGRDLQGLLDKDSVQMYYSNQSAVINGEKMHRNFHVSSTPEHPWVSSADMWETEDSLMDTQGQMHLNFLDQDKGVSLLNASQTFEGTGDSLRLDSTGIPPSNQTMQDMMLPNTALHGSMAESPHGSGLSKENSDREVKQEMRAESSDCSDPMDDDDEKGVARSGRRHLSKNLVAERKRRKKLNERLYSLRALVPKITKMDRASILGDAIEYVKELQQQVKELQDELLDTKKDELELAHGNGSLDDASGQTIMEEVKATTSGEEARALTKVDQLPVSVDVIEQSTDDLNQPMQVEVNKMDGQLFSLRIFCEKRPGIFVKLIQALECLGLDILHANITTFRGLVLNVFNAEVRDKDMIRADQVKESLLEMSQAGLRHCLSGDSQAGHQHALKEGL